MTRRATASEIPGTSVTLPTTPLTEGPGYTALKSDSADSQLPSRDSSVKG